MNAELAKAVFEAGLPRGPKGDLIPGHTTWEMLGPESQRRYWDMAHAALAFCSRTCHTN